MKKETHGLPHLLLDSLDSLFHMLQVTETKTLLTSG